MIFLKRLTLNNFLSHEKTEIEFSKDEKILIDGQSGAGKSSIFDAIIWALYGQGRTDNKSLVRKGSKKGSVCLELTRRGEKEGDEDTVIISRSINQAGKHALEITTEQRDGGRVANPLTGIRDLQKWIDTELIGASYALFINSVAYVQGSAESFVSQTAPKRKELLLEIIKAEDYDKHYERARGRLSELENAHSKGVGELGGMNVLLDQLLCSVGQKQSYLDMVEMNSNLLKEIRPRIKELEDKKINLFHNLREYNSLEESLLFALSEEESIKNELASKLVDDASKEYYEKEIEETNKKIDKYDKEVFGLREIFREASKIEALHNELGKEPNIIDRSKEILRIDENIERICKEPICPSGKDCPYSGDHDKQIEDLINQKEEYEEATMKEVLAFNKWNEEFQKLPNRVVDISKTLDKIAEAESALRFNINHRDEVQKARDEIKDKESEILLLKKSLEDKRIEIENIKKKKDELKNSIDLTAMTKIESELNRDKEKESIYNENFTRATIELEHIANDEVNVIDMKSKIDYTNKELSLIEDKIKKVTMAKEAFGPKGVKTLVIDYLLPKLEDNINNILSKLSDFRVRLDTQRKSADGDSIVEGLFITIINEMNEEMPFEAYSGGEKLKISVAISESLAALQKVNFRIFDEVFIGLDENSTEGFSAVLQNLQGNFSQVLCVSHLLQIKELFDKKINIVKNNNKSYVK